MASLALMSQATENDDMTHDEVTNRCVKIESDALRAIRTLSSLGSNIKAAGYNSFEDGVRALLLKCSNDKNAVIAEYDRQNNL